MKSKKTFWLGMAASVGIAPVLVACLAITPLLPAGTPPAFVPVDPNAPSNRSTALGSPTPVPLNAPGANRQEPLFQVDAWLEPPTSVAAPPNAALPPKLPANPTPAAPVFQPMPAGPIQNANYQVGVVVTEEEPQPARPAPTAMPIPTVPPPTLPGAAVVPVRYGSPTGNVLLMKQEKEQPKQKDTEVPPKIEPPPQTAQAPPTPDTTFRPIFKGFDTTPNVSPAQATAQQATPSDVISGQTPLSSLGAADLLTKSNTALGVEVQRRSPLVGDPRIEGMHFGQIGTYADGGYWFPARVDLDTVISKLNSDNINNILVIKGPFSARYGPGFSFLDVESLPTPRSTDGCFEAHGSTSMGYRTNGNAAQGQQSFWGGNTDWGFRLTYDIQAANDYSTGNGSSMPSAYNNQFVNFAYGVDLSRDTQLEVRYLHVQQSNVLFPGLLTDINELLSDAFNARLTSKDGPWYDKFTLDTWVNSTNFNGDSANPRTRQQIPQLDNILPTTNPANAALVGFNPVRLDMVTNGNALSYGTREITTWGAANGFNVSLGADLRVFSNNYNEFDSFNVGSAPFSGIPANLGIPYARQIDPGILLDTSIPIGEDVTIKAGGRMDFVTSQFISFGPNTDQGVYNSIVKDAQGDKAYFLFSGFASGEYKITQEWTARAGYGYAERPPTLTELYAGGAFLGLIQNGLNSIYGDPSLRKEEIHQIDLGLRAKYDTLRLGGNAFYAFLPNYITYNNLGPFTVNNPATIVPIGTTPINRLQFRNTNLATLYGFDAYGEYDVLPWLTPFATLSFVEGWDQEHNEALPGIPPLASRVGLRFHEPGTNPRLGVEYFARMVATQDLFASSLGEQRTGGFVVHYLRGYWQARENVMLLAGVENIGNLQYREHLDLRTGSGVPGSVGGVFQPGINFYFGLKLNY